MDGKSSRGKAHPTWQELPCISPPARTYFSMVSGSDEKLWVFGGFGEKKSMHNDLHNYDPSTGSWKQVKALSAPEARYLHAACSYNGKLYIHGGSISNKGSRGSALHESKDLMSYTFGESSWTELKPKGDIPCARYGHAMAVWRNRIVLAGGCKRSSEYMKDCYAYDPHTSRWSRLPDLPETVAYHSLFSVNGNLYMLFGYNGNANVGSLYRFSPGSLSWNAVSTTGPAPSARCGCTAEVVDENVYVFGGFTNGGHDNDLYKLDVTTMKWTNVKVNGVKPKRRAYLQSAFCKDHFYIFGGYNGKSCVSDFQCIRLANPELDLAKHLRLGSNKESADQIIRHYRGEDHNSLRHKDLVDLIGHIKKTIESVEAKASIAARNGVAAGPELSNEERNMVNQAVAMGIKRQTVLQCMLELKDTRGEIKDINLLINKAFAAMESGAPDKPPQVTQAKDGGDSRSNGGDEEEEEPPDELVCPISGQIFEDPVITDDGHTYERALIEDWFRRGTRNSPLTNKPLPSTTLRPNIVLRGIIEAWHKKSKAKKT
mmetsp:Transcript_22205/g.43198  ORF Transcript_22205/g.43198 Transcript_22205/m.43198 type:complete len:543 (-) Transcript_22205:161-1789(-)